MSPIVIEIAKAVAVQGTKELSRFIGRTLSRPRTRKTLGKFEVGPPEGRKFKKNRRVTGLGKHFGKSFRRRKKKRSR